MYAWVFLLLSETFSKNNVEEATWGGNLNARGNPSTRTLKLFYLESLRKRYVQVNAHLLFYFLHFASSLQSDLEKTQLGLSLSPASQLYVATYSLKRGKAWGFMNMD